jgi:hypothetical protein
MAEALNFKNMDISTTRFNANMSRCTYASDLINPSTLVRIIIRISLPIHFINVQPIFILILVAALIVLSV